MCIIFFDRDFNKDANTIPNSFKSSQEALGKVTDIDEKLQLQVPELLVNLKDLAEEGRQAYLQLSMISAQEQKFIVPRPRSNKLGHRLRWNDAKKDSKHRRQNSNSTVASSEEATGDNEAAIVPAPPDSLDDKGFEATNSVESRPKTPASLNRAYSGVNYLLRVNSKARKLTRQLNVDPPSQDPQVRCEGFVFSFGV